MLRKRWQKVGAGGSNGGELWTGSSSLKEFPLNIFRIRNILMR
jgi:hypothetical protein